MDTHPYKSGDEVVIINNEHHKKLIVGDVYTVRHVSNTLLGCIPCANTNGYDAICITECQIHAPFKNLPLFAGLTV